MQTTTVQKTGTNRMNGLFRYPYRAMRKTTNVTRLFISFLCQSGNTAESPRGYVKNSQYRDQNNHYHMPTPLGDQITALYNTDSIGHVKKSQKCQQPYRGQVHPGQR